MRSQYMDTHTRAHTHTRTHFFDSIKQSFDALANSQNVGVYEK